MASLVNMAASTTSTCGRFLLLLAQEHVEFRLPELKALFSVCGKHLECNTGGSSDKGPFLVVLGTSEETIRKVMERTVSAKSAIELWGMGKTHQELLASLKPQSEHIRQLCHPESSFKITIHTFNKTLQYNERLQRIESLDVLPFNGRVDLKNPDHNFFLLEDYGLDPNNVPTDPLCLYFGRWLVDGQRDLLRSYSVKTRHFIGNTSMDAGLAFIMANHARVQPGHLVCDPFVGTGSLLVACARFGAFVMGSDIDYNTIHGLGKASRKNQKWRGPDENIRANLRQYGLEQLYADVLVSDASRPIWRPHQLFDAILTDPPYGIRESTRKIGSYGENGKVPDDVADNHIPDSREYHLSDIFVDLLNFAAEYLVNGGRLVYWLPVFRPDYTEEIVPRHPCLKLVSNCEQMLNSQSGRRLLTMQKIKDFEEVDRYAHMQDVRQNPYKGHNAFRDKYFSGLTKERARECE
uniref:tRNA (guanine(10)-N(2))-methyltransferase TRMT11 n=1 Tax=Petromyzon marinus TaxID=7757 RepID=A0AAJ7TVM9_PETMA|nr:tRNA (guanine(10)-N2)-methyltransferase homolog [Petromyzon marinus]